MGIAQVACDGVVFKEGLDVHAGEVIVPYIVIVLPYAEQIDVFLISLSASILKTDSLSDSRGKKQEQSMRHIYKSFHFKSLKQHQLPLR